MIVVKFKKFSIVFFIKSANLKKLFLNVYKEIPWSKIMTNLKTISIILTTCFSLSSCTVDDCKEGFNPPVDAETKEVKAGEVNMI